MQTVINRTKNKRIEKRPFINKGKKRPSIETKTKGQKKAEFKGIEYSNINPMPLNINDALSKIYLEMIEQKNINIDCLNNTIDKVISKGINLDLQTVRLTYKRTLWDSYRRENTEQRIFEGFELSKHDKSKMPEFEYQEYLDYNRYLVNTVCKRLKQHKAKTLFVWYYVFGLTQKQIAKKFSYERFEFSKVFDKNGEYTGIKKRITKRHIVNQSSVSRKLKNLNFRISNMPIKNLVNPVFALSNNGGQKIRMKQRYDEILKIDGLKKFKTGSKTKGQTVWAKDVNMIDIESYQGVKSKRLEKDQYNKWTDPTACRSGHLKTALRQSSGFVSDNLTEPIPFIDIPVLAVNERPVSLRFNVSNQDSTQYHYNNDGDIIRVARGLTANTIKYVNSIDNEIKFNGRMFPDMVKARYELNQKMIDEMEV